MSLTNAQILAIIDAGGSVTFNRYTYTSANRADVPNDAAIAAIIAAQHEAGLPTETLDDLTDVIASGASAGQLLGYDAATGKWKKVTFAVDETNLTKVWDGSSGLLLIQYIRPNPSMNELADAGMSRVDGHAIVWREGPFVWGDSRIFRVKDDYDGGAPYIRDDVVYVDSVFYIALADSTGQDPATSPTYWYPIGTGTGGGAIGAMSWQGAWSGSTDYLIGDVVSSGGNIYVSLTDHLAGGDTPPHDITGGFGNWALLATSISGMVGTNNLSELSDIAVARSNLGAMASPMTSTGDLIYQPLSNVNVALSSLGAAASASGSDPTSLPAKLIDGIDDNAHSWAGVAPSPIGTWVKVDLGTAQLIGSMRLHQEPAGSWGQYRIQHYVIESSLDNVNWTTLEASHNAASVIDDTYTLASGPVTARYFRLTTLDLASAQWGIWTWEIRTAPGASARLPIGSTGQIFTVVGGIPAWVTPLPRMVAAGAFTLSAGVSNITVPAMAGTNAVLATFSEAPSATDKLYTAVTSSTSIRISSLDATSTKSGYYQIIRFA